MVECFAQILEYAQYRPKGISLQEKNGPRVKKNSNIAQLLISKEKLRTAKKAHNAKFPDDKITQERLALELGVEKGTFSRWVTGKRKRGIPLPHLRQIAARLHVHPNDLLESKPVSLDETPLDNLEPISTKSPPQFDLTSEGDDMDGLLGLMTEILKPINRALESLQSRVDDNTTVINRALGNFGPHLEEFHKDLGKAVERLAELDKRLTAMEQQSAWRTGSTKKRVKRSG